MSYIHRDENNNIISISEMSDKREEAINPENTNEVLAFLNKPLTELNRNLEKELQHSDQVFMRVLDDLITALIEKEVIHLTDLPAIARKKYTERSLIRKLINSDESED